MLERREQEIKLLRKQYGAVDYDADAGYLLFKEFKIPTGWNREVTELLVVIPVAYPTTPPDNFYVPVGFKTAAGATPTNYSESVTHMGKQWGQFSYHLDGEWRPAANILDGDNLLTFMLKVLDRLKEIN